MEWASVINNPFLKDLPFKIELNKWGKILMSPASNNHGRLQYEVGRRIDRQKGSGKIIMECSIKTSDGVKVADVAWASDAFIAKYGYSTPYIKAPEICVEITSPSNSTGEIEEKVQLYPLSGKRRIGSVVRNAVFAVRHGSFWVRNEAFRVRSGPFAGRNVTFHVRNEAFTSRFGP